MSNVELPHVTETKTSHFVPARKHFCKIQVHFTQVQVNQVPHMIYNSFLSEIKLHFRIISHLVLLVLKYTTCFWHSNSVNELTGSTSSETLGFPQNSLFKSLWAKCRFCSSLELDANSTLCCVHSDWSRGLFQTNIPDLNINPFSSEVTWFHQYSSSLAYSW